MQLESVTRPSIRTLHVTRLIRTFTIPCLWTTAGMTLKTWASATSREAFFHPFIDEYISVASDNSNKGAAQRKAFFSRVLATYFDKYHWSLAVNVEPLEGATYSEPAPGDADARSKKQKRKGELSVVSSFHLLHFS